LKLFRCDQRTDEWFELHLGRVTASYMSAVMDFRKTGDKGPGSNRIAYMGKKIAETLTGLIDQQGYVSPAMRWGNEKEDEARRAYEMAREVMVDRIGFGIHPQIDLFGASPDGLIGDDGMLEIKCPETSTHIRWIEGQQSPEEHWPQMWAQMAVFGRKWCQFISYDPRLTCRYQLFIPPPLELSVESKSLVETYVGQFLGEMNAKIDRLGELCPALLEEAKLPAALDAMLSDDDIAWAQKNL
jgi:putative phage-type endonuclease